MQEQELKVQELIFIGFEGLSDESGNIYISNLKAAKNLNLLQRLNIKATISAARGLLLPYTKPEMPNYLYLPIDDNESQEILTFLPFTFDFIEKNKARSNILIHCQSGISRSCSLLIGYLIKKYSYSFQEAFSLLKRKNKRINPNKHFIKQLQKYQIHLSNLNSATSLNQADPDTSFNSNNQKRQLNSAKQETSREISMHLKSQNNPFHKTTISSQISKELVEKLQKIKSSNRQIENSIVLTKLKFEENDIKKRSRSEYFRQRVEQRSKQKVQQRSMQKSMMNSLVKSGQKRSDEQILGRKMLPTNLII